MRALRLDERRFGIVVAPMLFAGLEAERGHLLGFELLQLRIDVEIHFPATDNRELLGIFKKSY